MAEKFFSGNIYVKFGHRALSVPSIISGSSLHNLRTVELKISCNNREPKTHQFGSIILSYDWNWRDLLICRTI